MQGTSKKSIRALVMTGMIVLSASTAFAGHPLITDDAGIVEVKHAEIELNGAYNHDRDTFGTHVNRTESTEGEVKVTTGIFKDAQVAVTVPYTFNSWGSEDNIMVERSSGFGDMTAELKYKFLEYRGIQFAAKPYVLIPSGKYSAGLSDGRWGYGVALIATREFDEGTYALHANAVYEYHDYRNPAVRDENRADIWKGSIAGEAELLKNLKGMVDFGVSTTPDKAINDASAYALVGASYEVCKGLEVNAGAKFGLTKAEDDISILWGATIKF